MYTKKGKPQKNGLVVLAFAAIAITILFVIFGSQQNLNRSDVYISEMIKNYKDGKYSLIIQDKNQLIAKGKDENGNIFEEVATKPTGDSLTELGFFDKNIGTEIKEIDNSGEEVWLNIIYFFLPTLLIAGLIFFMIRQAQNSANSAFSFGKSKARQSDKQKTKIKFTDIAGAKEAKEALVEVVDFLKKPKKYLKMGAEIPRGALLVGPPGTGKTLLAKAVAGEASVPFFNISGSEFVEMFVGVGASRVRDLFKKAKKNAPAIIFIDEIDAVGRRRGAGLGGGHDEREQTLNQILTEMDGFETDASVIVMAATNRPDVLDPALLRPGRFDRRVVVENPDIKDRKAILEVHVKNKPLSKNTSLERIARITPGFSGADLRNVLNEAAIIAAKENKKKITQKYLEEAVEKVILGPERKSRVLNEKEKEITAYHEVGHAIVGHVLKNTHPIHKVSIVSRGMALGVTWQMPEEDTYLKSEDEFYDEIASLLGGRMAEKTIFGKVTTGAGNDLERASKIARMMVTKFGMSKELGQVVFGGDEEVFLGRDFVTQKDHSEETGKIIDEAVSRIVTESFERAKKILTKYKPKLITISKKLIEIETLTGDEFEKLIGVKKGESKKIKSPIKTANKPKNTKARARKTRKKNKSK